MNLVSDLDLPAFDYAAPDFSADRFHARLAGIGRDGPPQPGGVEGVFGVDKLPVTWSGSNHGSSNHGRAPDVS